MKYYIKIQNVDFFTQKNEASQHLTQISICAINCVIKKGSNEMCALQSATKPNKKIGTKSKRVRLVNWWPKQWAKTVYHSLKIMI